MKQTMLGGESINNLFVYPVFRIYFLSKYYVIPLLMLHTHNLINTFSSAKNKC